ncbi:MAG: hypothetical protein KR126chlam1_00614 [Chlamydiae bacterium]|nr:hypothetical protein [Chlamydiota bacterium]
MSAIAFSPVYRDTNTEQSVQPRTLNPLLKYDAVSEQTSNIRWSRVWTVAAIVSTVAFLALAVGALIYTNFYAADLALLACILCASSAPLAYSVFRHFWEKSNACVSEAAFAGGIIEQKKELTDVKVQEFLDDTIGNSPLQPEQQKWLVARYNHLEGLQQKATQLALPMKLGNNEVREIFTKGELHQVKVDDYAVDKVDLTKFKQAAIFQELQKGQLRILNHAIEAQQWKINQAYLLKVLQTPEVIGMESYLTEIKLPPLNRLIAEHSGDSSAFTLIKTKTSKRSYSVHDLNAMSVLEVAREVFGLRSNF